MEARTKQFPKIPRWDHPVVSEELFKGNVAIATEKVDGGNFRWMVYDEGFDFPADVEEHNPRHGEIVYGTRTKIQGVSPTNNSHEDAYETIQENVDVNEVFDLHDKYGGPLIWFGELMWPHTLEYWDDDTPVPDVVGFDVYCRNMDPDPNPVVDIEHMYEETFEGFFGYHKAKNLWDEVTIETDRIDFAPKVFEEELHTTDIEDEIVIPQSTYSSIQAEGVVLEISNRRVKVHREDFKELNKKTFFATEDLCHECRVKDKTEADVILGESADAGAEYVANTLCSEVRIRKHVLKMIDDSEEFGMHLMRGLPDKVFEDIWLEEGLEIAQMDIIFNPQSMRDYIDELCKAQLQKMNQEAKKKGEDPPEYWGGNT